jgi:hypothetical protein
MATLQVISTSSCLICRNVLEVPSTLVPEREELVRRSIFGCLDRAVLDDKEAELDDLAMLIQHIDFKLAKGLFQQRINDWISSLSYRYEQRLTGCNLWR